MSQIIDRRLNGKNKSAVNRQRFMRRFQKQIKHAVTNAVSKRSITEIDKGEQIIIPTQDTTEPRFLYGSGGMRETVHPGNTEFVKGDRIKRPQAGGKGQGSSASDTGEGVDDFAFDISRDEFLELFFEDLALPDLVKTDIAQLPDYKFVRAGITTTGVPSNINIVRTMRHATARRIALTQPKRAKLVDLEAELAKMLLTSSESDEQVVSLVDEIVCLKEKISKTPFIDTFDLRYNNRTKQPRPNNQAVMFCLMDVSGSMDEVKKDIAKRFFIMLYLFLKRNYERIDIVFIRHHTSAKEVDEEEFFYSRETGGTVVSSALELMSTTVVDRYPTSAWNIYAAQASDGDNWNADSPYCHDILSNQILSNVQYYAYVEIMPRHHQSLWEVYSNLERQHTNFAMQTIEQLGDIYPVFRNLFARNKA